MTDGHDKIKVTLCINVTDEQVERVQALSPRLVVTRHYPDVPDAAWAETEILYTLHRLPVPEQAPRLRWIQLHTAGVEHVLNERIIKAEDITLTSASGIHTRQLAQYCLMMLLAFHFKLPRMFEMQRRAEWRKDRHSFFAPGDLHRQTLGIVGYGSIGRELARLAHSAGMTILASKRNVMQPAENPGEYAPAGTGDPAGDLPERIYPPEALATMVRDCDYVAVITPLTAQTRHLINASVLKAMKPTAVLINVARGEVVDEAALIEALQQGTIGGAALDVFEQEPLPASSPLWQMENVIISPHCAGNSSTYNDKGLELFLENVRLYLEKKPLLNRINRDTGY